MAVATPELEMRIEGTQEEVRRESVPQTYDEIHNARISDIFAKIMRSDTKMSDFRASMPVQQAPEQEVNMVVTPVQPEARFVEGARTDAQIFRADSAINRRVTIIQAEEQPEVIASAAVTEEENEYSMPTRTTMQYTTENKEADEAGTVVNASAEKRIRLAKRDKIIIAVVVSIIVALFALIIINSVLISGLNNDLSSLQTSLKNARSAYDHVTNEITDYKSNFGETLRALAERLGMIK